MFVPVHPLSRDSCNINAPLQRRRNTTTTTLIRAPIPFRRRQLDIPARIAAVRGLTSCPKFASPSLALRRNVEFVYLFARNVASDSPGSFLSGEFTYSRYGFPRTVLVLLFAVVTKRDAPHPTRVIIQTSGITGHPSTTSSFSTSSSCCALVPWSEGEVGGAEYSACRKT